MFKVEVSGSILFQQMLKTSNSEAPPALFIRQSKLLKFNLSLECLTSYRQYI